MAGILNAEVAFPKFPTLDPYGPNTTLLLHGDGANAAQNNTFIDSSSNGFSITRNGNTTQGTFTPFSQPNGWWSNYFNGSSDYLYAASNAAFAPGTGDFAIQCWAYFSSISTYSVFFQNESSVSAAGSDKFWFGYNSGNLAVGQHSTSNRAYAVWTPVIGQWYHLAASRVSGTVYIWINGVSQTVTNSTQYSSTSFGQNGLAIGVVAGSGYFNGYISNLQYQVGTGFTTLTLPTTPILTPGTNAKLLTCQSNRFVDNSTNAFAITPGGTPSVQAFHPISAPTAYYPAVNGGAGYFDGSGDSLVAPNSTQLTFGTSDFTIECWVYRIGSGVLQGIFDERTAAANETRPTIYINTSNSIIYYTAAADRITTSLPQNTWTHVAVVRNSSVTTMYINGVSAGTYSDTNNYLAPTNNALVGALVDGYSLNGYISNFRVVKGTAVYTSTFTPPTAPLTAITNTQLLLSCTNAGIIDSVSQNALETVGNAQVSTTQSKFGGASMYFDGINSALTIPNNPRYDFGTSDFTIELFFYLAGNSAPSPDNNRYAALFCAMFDVTADNGYNLQFNGNTTTTGTGIVFDSWNSGTRTNIINYSGTITQSIWYHLALVRSGTLFSLYLNGISVATATSSVAINTGGYQERIGCLQQGSAPKYYDYFNGYIDDLRITKGIARYTQNFTPPQNAYPDYGPLTNIPTVDPAFNYNTVLLHGNGTDGTQNNTFIDSSSNIFSITRNGNTTQGTFTPFSQPNGWWSNYFNGSGDTIFTQDNAAFNLANSAFTIEMFIFMTAYNNYGLFCGQWAGGTSTTAYAFRQNNAKKLQFVYTTNGTTEIPITGTTDIPLNSWVHICVCRDSSNNWALYLNGSREATYTASDTIYDAARIFQMGAGGGSPPLGDYFTGYISNLRFVKGSTVYNPTQLTLTIPTSPLTAVANTQFLTCQSNRFVDNSTNAFAITTSGTPSVQNRYPFFPPLDYSTAAIGGSGYFDGSGDYLSLASTSALAFGTGDFTVECWLNFAAVPSSAKGILEGQSAGSFNFYYDGGTYVSNVFVVSNRLTNQISYSFTPSANAWYHLAVSRSGTSLKLFINGTAVSTVTNSTNYGTAAFDIGGDSGGGGAWSWNGYISNLRVIKGTAIYTADFTPPTAPLTAITNTQLLLSCTNAGIFDNASKTIFETVGGAKISNTQSKFGGTSMYFDGSGDGLYAPNSPNLTFGTADFTIEFWIYRVGNNVYQVVFDERIDATTQARPTIYFNSVTNKLVYYTQGSEKITGVVDVNIWTHAAVVRSSSVTTLYINGTSVGTYADTNNYLAPTTGVYIGSAFNGNSLNGFLQDFRITNGFARYRYNFTPPLALFPNK